MDEEALGTIQNYIISEIILIRLLCSYILEFYVWKLYAK